MRQGDFKLLQFHEDGRFELYKLKGDISQTKNVANIPPGKVAFLRKKIEKYTGAQMPLPNPD